MQRILGDHHTIWDKLANLLSRKEMGTGGTQENDGQSPRGAFSGATIILNGSANYKTKVEKTTGT